MIRRLSLLLVLCLCGCAGWPSKPALRTLQGESMGTTWTVKLVPSAQTPPLAQLQAGIETRLATVDAQMSTWKPDSDLSRFNRAPAGSWQILPPELFTVLQHALQLARDTDGAYDPTVGALVGLWGFGPHKSNDTAAPDAGRIAQARQTVGWQRLRIDANTRRVLQPGGSQLDLSSIAPGFAVDQIARYLDGVGVHDYLVEHGGELHARGQRPEGGAWRVGIEQPDAGDSDGLAMVVRLDNRGSGSSGDYRKFIEIDGQRRSHHIDPRTGAPIAHALASVTVLDTDTLHADANAAALMVLGPEQGLAYARRHGLAALFIVRSGQGFEQRMTPEFAAARE